VCYTVDTIRFGERSHTTPKKLFFVYKSSRKEKKAMLRVSTVCMKEFYAAISKNVAVDVVMQKHRLCYLYACKDFNTRKPLTLSRTADPAPWNTWAMRLPDVVAVLWQNKEDVYKGEEEKEAGRSLLNELDDQYLAHNCGARGVIGNSWGLLELTRLDEKSFKVLFFITGDEVEIEKAMNAGIVYTLRTGRAPFESDLMPGRFSPEEGD